MRTTYIFDTSVLITDPRSFETFKESDAVIPITVLDELDKLKKMPSEAGKNARVVIRLLDKLSNMGDIVSGVAIDDGIVVKIDTNKYSNDFGDSLYGDNRILSCASWLNKANKLSKVVLLTNDINLRIRARAAGIESSGYVNNNAVTKDIFSGVKIIKDDDLGLELLQNGFIDTTLGLNQNEAVVFKDENDNVISMGRAIKDNVKVIKKKYPSSLSPRNVEQALAIDLLYDDNLPLVTLLGRAGCGKTLVSLAVAIELVLQQKRYDKLIIYRPIQPVGNDIGYLPGEMSEKLDPWFKAIEDNLEVLFKDSKGEKNKITLEMLKKKGIINFEPLTYIRGRSIPNAIIIADETQNISVGDIKSVLTRAGENSKIILTGDIEQIDNPGLDAINNGLTYVIDKFKSSDLAGHITFTQGERSKLATEAAKIL